MKKLAFYKFASGVIALTLGSSLAHADVRVQKLCYKPISVPSSTGSKPVCFADPETITESCTVGVRGDWLDTTNKVVYVSGPRVTPTIEKKGVDRQIARNGIEVCDPGANKDREGFVELKLKNIEGSGTLRLKLERPGGSDTISIPIKNGSQRIGTHPITVGLARDQPIQTVRFAIHGKSLDTLRVKTQADIDTAFRNAGGSTGNTFRIVETHTVNVNPPAKSESATIEVRTNGFSNNIKLINVKLTDIVQFPQGTSEFNATFGSPFVGFGLALSSSGSSSLPRGPILINQGRAGDCARNAAGACI